MKFSGTSIDISAKFRTEVDRLRRLGAESRQVARRASGTLLRRLPVEARRDIQEQVNLTTRRINFDLSARAAGAGVIELVGRRRRIGVIQYRGRWPGRRSAGATVQIDRGGGRELWDGGGAFIAVGLSGNRHVFERRGRPRRMERGNYAGKMRQPIEVQYEGSIADYLVERGRPERLADYAQTVLASEMTRLLARAH